MSSNNLPHTSHDELNKMLLSVIMQLPLGTIYKHYKYIDRDYQILGYAIQESSQKVCIRYRNIKEDNAPEFVRDYDSWIEEVEWNGAIVPRFKPVILET